MLELGFNSAVQASTQHAPFELLYGVQARLPIDVALDALAPRNPAAVIAAQRMRRRGSFARDHLLAAQERQTRNADRHRRADASPWATWCCCPPRDCSCASATSSARFIGPFHVTAVVNANAYTLAAAAAAAGAAPDLQHRQAQAVPRRPSGVPARPPPYDRPPPAWQPTPTATPSGRSSASWRSAAPGAASIPRGWRGYPPEENTWEPRASLTDTAPAVLGAWRALQRQDGTS